MGARSLADMFSWQIFEFCRDFLEAYFEAFPIDAHAPCFRVAPMRFPISSRPRSVFAPSRSPSSSIRRRRRLSSLWEMCSIPSTERSS